MLAGLLFVAINTEPFEDTLRPMTLPLTLILGAYLMFGWTFPLAIGREQPDTSQRVERVRASGPRIASAMCSAQVGRLRLSGPLLNVAVHPGGIVLKPVFVAPRSILVSEIEALEIKRLLWLRYLSVRHTAPDVASKVILYIGVDSPVARAIEILIGRDAYEAS
jgi:hypothetical protein